MNERIKQLAEQAWPEIPKNWWDRQDGAVAEAVNNFAELIVRECADACDELAEKLSEQRPNSNYDAVAYECAEHIKTHFGFET